MDQKDIKKLKKYYEQEDIPEQLDWIIEKSLKKKRRKTYWNKILIGAIAAIALFATTVNISPVFAKKIATIPLMNQIVKVLTFSKYEVEEENYKLHVEVPNIKSDSREIQELNKKYNEEGEKLYKEFKKDMDDMKKSEQGNMGIESGYKVVTQTDNLLSLYRYEVNTVGSSSTTRKYDTVDLKQERIITLPSLFVNDTYVNIISENIKEQMKKQVVESKDEKIYWVEGGGIPKQELFDPFKSIHRNQSFYINNHNKLVIVFDKYEVAPGFMGICEFEIPTKTIQSILLNNKYIQ